MLSRLSKKKGLINLAFRQFLAQNKTQNLLKEVPFATVDPTLVSEKSPYTVQNKVNGEWKTSEEFETMLDPMNGDKFLFVPKTNKESELKLFTESMEKCPKFGLHNPLKNVERVMPKSYAQAAGEVAIVRKFLENFSGDQPRFLCRGFHVSGDHYGQTSMGYAWPYGPVSLIAPFNFPLEIHALQLIGALIAGNKVLLKSDSRVSVVAEQFQRLLSFCGMPAGDVDFINCDGAAMQSLLTKTHLRMNLFTGSSRVANHLASLLKGKIKVEDAGFDWKILGPDVQNFDYVAWTCDQDAYACTGQKCSAQSILFVHENWMKKGLIPKLKEQAAKRKLEDLTVGPVLSWNNNRIKEHIQKCLAIPGAEIAFGGKELKNHKIPSIYGSYEPTAVYVPFKEVCNEKNHDVVLSELFGPFQIITTYRDFEIDQVLKILETMDNHLTAGIVSNDIHFLNHEAILKTWTCHREIIHDVGPVIKDWTIPDPS